MDSDSKEIYFLMDPNGKQVIVPKEVFEALSDFVKTRKHSGSITIEYHGGEVTHVHFLAKKTIKR